MTRLRGITAFLLLTALLVAGQAGAALHALQHHAGVPQGEICSTCVTVAQLGVASVDNTVAGNLEAPPAAYASVVVPVCQPRHTFVARQRGPPAPL